jgi:hypothetical protein
MYHVCILKQQSEGGGIERGFNPFKFRSNQIMNTKWGREHAAVVFQTFVLYSVHTKM